MDKQVDFEKILKKFKEYEDHPEFPPVGDYHSANTYAINGDEFKEAYVLGQKGQKKYKLKFKDMRGVGKRVGLAMSYGGTEYAVSHGLGISKEKAGVIIEKFFSKLDTFKKNLKGRLNTAKSKGMIKGMFGRIRYLPKIKDDNFKIRFANERLAYNAPIQMAGATSLKFIKVFLGKWIEEGKLNRFHGNLINTYHPYTRIVSINSSKVTSEFKEYISNLELGNCKVIVKNENGHPIEEFTQPVRLKMSDIKKFGLNIDF